MYASQVPLLADAKFEDAMGGNYYGEGLNDLVSETMACWFTTKMSPDELEAFFEKNLRGATNETDEEGEAVFRLVPQGAEDGEDVYVKVRKDRKIKIGEEYKPGKRKSEGSL